jgi:hypothetical protein
LESAAFVTVTVQVPTRVALNVVPLMEHPAVPIVVTT